MAAALGDVDSAVDDRVARATCPRRCRSSTVDPAAPGTGGRPTSSPTRCAVQPDGRAGPRSRPPPSADAGAPAGGRPGPGHPAGRPRAGCSSRSNAWATGRHRPGSGWGWPSPRASDPSRRRRSGTRRHARRRPDGRVPATRRRRTRLRRFTRHDARCWSSTTNRRSARRSASTSGRGATTWTLAATGEEALHLAAARRPDVVLLDLGLPGIDGVEVIEGLRGWSEVPIIVLSVRGEETDKVAALDAGADDYVTKPFGMAELLARLRAAIRRQHPEPEKPDRHRRRTSPSTSWPSACVVGDEEVRLTPTEWALVEQLVRHPGMLVSQRQLLHEVWGPQYDQETNYLRVHLANVRRKLEPDAVPAPLLRDRARHGLPLRAGRGRPRRRLTLLSPAVLFVERRGIRDARRTERDRVGRRSRLLSRPGRVGGVRAHGARRRWRRGGGR